MIYLVTQILVWLVLAVVIGGLIGWHLRSLMQERHLKTLEEALEACHEHGKTIEHERNALFARVDALEQANHDLNGRLLLVADDEKQPQQTEDLASVQRRLQILEETSRVLQSRLAHIDLRTGSQPLEKLGILSPEQLNRFRELGIENTAQLIDHCHQPNLCEQLQQRTGLDQALLQRLCEIADLLRLPGISPPVAELLNAGDIHSIEDLASCPPYRFALKLKRVNAEHQLLPTAPAASIVTQWINAAVAMQANENTSVPCGK